MDTKTMLLTNISAIELLDLHPVLLRDSRPKAISCPDLPAPVEILLPRGRHPRKGSFSPHWATRTIAPSDRVSVNASLSTLCPEAAILRMCRSKSLPQVIALIDQLCGTYRIPRKEAIPAYAAAFKKNHAHFIPPNAGPADCRGAAFYGIKPLTSVRSIESFMSSHPGFPGSKSIRRALPFCVDGLRSHLEMSFYTLACLPRRHGGCNLPSPQVNYQIDLPSNLQQLCGKPYMLADEAWPDQKVCVELLGISDHSGDGITDTSVREKAYAELGWTCVTMTKREVDSLPLFMNGVRRLAKLLKFRLRKDLAGYDLRQRWLREELLVRSDQTPPNVKSYKQLPATPEIASVPVDQRSMSYEEAHSSRARRTGLPPGPSP